MELGKLHFKRNTSRISRILKQFFSQSSAEEHIYLKVPFKSHQELAYNLKENVVYNRDGIIAVNKPYGLKRYREDQQNKKMITMSPSMSATNHLSLQETLPYLAKELNVEKLIVAKCPERYTSGVCVMTTDLDLMNTIVRKFAGCKLPHYNFVAVCAGVPNVKEYKCKLGLTKKASKLHKEDKKMCFVEDWSRASLKRGEVRQVKVHHNTISCNEDGLASLVQVLISRVGKHSVRLYLASRIFSPLLGDNIYGSLVQTVAGIPVLVNMWNPVASQKQNLSKPLREKLELMELKNTIVPAHLHLTQIKLPRINKGKDLVITANPPEHFMWTCRALGLDMNAFNYNMFHDTDKFDLALDNDSTDESNEGDFTDSDDEDNVSQNVAKLGR